MPRHSNYSPGQFSSRSAPTRLRYSDWPLPDDEGLRCIIELITLDDLRGDQQWPPHRRLVSDETPLATGMLVATISGERAAPDAQLWVYCGSRTWLPASNMLHMPYTGFDRRLRRNIRHEIASAAANWLLLAPETRACIACTEAVKDLLRAQHHAAVPADYAAFGSAIASILACGDSLPYGRHGIYSTAAEMLRLELNGQLDLLSHHIRARTGLHNLVSRVPPNQRYPLLAQFAEQLGLNLNASRPEEQSAEPKVKVNSRRVRFVEKHGEIENLSG